MNFAPAVGIAVIIYRFVCLLSAMAAMYVQNVISVFVTTALPMPSVRKYGERGRVFMKLLNYDTRTLIMQNLRQDAKREMPTTFTAAQYKILCNLIRTKPISRKFFDFLLSELYGLKDWRGLDYSQMYQLIHILTYYDYQKERASHE